MEIGKTASIGINSSPSKKGLIGILRKHAKKGRLVVVQGMLRTREFADASTGEKRWITEVQLNPINSQVQFLDKLESTDQEQSAQDQGSGTNTCDNDEIPF